MSKRILMISYHTCPLASEEGKETGGMNIYVYELSKSLSKMGIKVDVITRSQEEDKERIVQVDENFRVIHLDAGPHSPLDKKKLMEYLDEFADSFKTFVQNEKLNYDLIHAHYYQSGLIALKITENLLKNIPFIMTFHTLALMKNLVARTPQEMESQVRIDAEFILTLESDAIITPSSSDKEYLQYLYNTLPQKIFEIPPGVNTSLFKPMDKKLAKEKIKLEGTEKIILFVGRVEPLKGIDVLLYALKILLSQAPDLKVRLLIVGGDISEHITKWSPQLKKLEELRHILGISSEVEFVGQKPQHELPYYYKASEVVVMPSHYESFGMAAAEAMACEIPVIMTNVTGISNLIDEERSTLITTVNNPLLLASQIKQLLTDQDIYQKTRKNIMENTRNLSWDKIAQKIVEVYNKIDN
jgi:D-inositol-3-phosphate glycosyltransferase